LEQSWVFHGDLLGLDNKITLLLISFYLNVLSRIAQESFLLNQSKGGEGRESGTAQIPHNEPLGIMLRLLHSVLVFSGPINGQFWNQKSLVAQEGSGRGVQVSTGLVAGTLGSPCNSHHGLP
jgi:hypothetical protein